MKEFKKWKQPAGDVEVFSKLTAKLYRTKCAA